jgi:hypothetical protein
VSGHILATHRPAMAGMRGEAPGGSAGNVCVLSAGPPLPFLDGPLRALGSVEEWLRFLLPGERRAYVKSLGGGLEQARTGTRKLRFVF